MFIPLINAGIKESVGLIAVQLPEKYKETYRMIHFDTYYFLFNFQCRTQKCKQLYRILCPTLVT